MEIQLYGYSTSIQTGVYSDESMDCSETFKGLFGAHKKDSGIERKDFNFRH